MSGKARTFKAYPKYKDSGVEWLGDVPADWDIRRLKNVSTINPQSLDEDTDPAMEIVYVDIGGVDGLGRIIERETLMFANAPSRARRLVEHGDVIVSTVRTYLRAIASINNPDLNMVVSTGFAVVRPRKGVLPSYAAYLLRSPFFVERVVSESKGVSFPAINETEMATFDVPRPSETEQRAIAAFLDRETARIDALVAKKERLIELLQEKRSALITRAVTKGLDPNVPMKDSGVEWLGSVPIHWTVMPLAYGTVARCDGPFGSGLKSEHYAASGVRVVRLQNIGWAEFLAHDEAYISEAYARTLGDHSVVAGDLLIAGLGDEGHPVGRSCVAPSEIEPAMVKADCFRFRLDRRILLSEFAALQMSSTSTAAAGFLTTGATRARMNLTATAARKIAFPSIDEQRAIVDLVGEESSLYSDLTGQIRSAIKRLLELRTTLISTAVTGKIDIREEVV